MIDEPHLTVVENTPEDEDELPVVPASVAEDVFRRAIQEAETRGTAAGASAVAAHVVSDSAA